MKIKNIPLEISIETSSHQCEKLSESMVVRRFLCVRLAGLLSLFLLGVFCLPSVVYAGKYDFRIKVINKTDADLEIQMIKYSGYQINPLYIDVEALSVALANRMTSPQTAPKLSAGESFLYDPPDDSRRKRKRRFELLYRCTAKHSLTENMRQYFPRNKKWYKRAHAVNNNNRYILKVKNSDC